MNGRIILHFLPPDCPDHNRIERRWQDLCANVTATHRYSSMPSLMNEVASHLRRRNVSHVESAPRHESKITAREPLAEAFADHDACEVRVRARHRRHDARVGDEKIFHAVDATA